MCRNGDVAKRQKVGRQKLGLDVSTLVQRISVGCKRSLIYVFSYEYSMKRLIRMKALTFFAGGDEEQSGRHT